MHRAFRVSIGLCVGLSSIVLLPGCGQGSILGNRYNNFRAYYNTFYNARKAFDAGEEALQQSEGQIDRSRFISIFPATQSGAATTSTQFEQAIEKSADLLRERPDSKWADDALLLIGKAYFYENNVVGAEGKFRETIETALEREQPELADEARFWLGRTLVAGERYEEATAVLEEGLSRPEIRSKWRSKMLLAIGELYVQQRRWPDAAEALRAGIPETKENELSGRAQFLLGQVLEADGRYEEAASAYAGVAGHRPVYELAYAAQLSEALVLGTDGVDVEQALELVRRMRRDDKNFQNRAEVELAYTRLLAASEQLDEADERFNRLLYDEEFRSSNVRGEAYYRYAEFFRDKANDYVRAAAYFDTAATNVRVEPGREELVTRVALRDVRRSAEVYRSYASIAAELAEADSLLHLGGLSPEDFRAAIVAIEQERLRRWEAEQQLLAARRAEQGFGNAPRTGGGEFPVEDEGRGAVGDGGLPASDAGFLNYRDLARRQDAMLAFERVWGDRPLGPNWRRLDALRSSFVAGNGPNEGGDRGANNPASSGGPPPLNLSNVPRTEEAQARLRTERAELRYELGNVFFLSLAKPDSAAHWYGLVLSDDADQPVVARARYALAEVRGGQGRDAEAEELYRQIIDEEPQSLQAAQARERLGLPPLEENALANVRADALAEYGRAYSLWEGGSYRLAIARMLDLGAAASDENVSPRALLVSGLIFTEWARADGFVPDLGIPGEIVPGVLLDEARAFDGGGRPPEQAGDVLQAEPLGEPDEETDDAPSDDDELGKSERILRGIEQQNSGDAPPTDADSPTDSLASKMSAEEALHADSVTVDGREGIPVEADPLTNESADINMERAQTGLVGDSTSAVLAGPRFESSADSSGIPSEVLGLTDLYRIIETRYPSTEYAARASARRAAYDAVYAPQSDVFEAVEDSVEVERDVMASLPQEVVDAAAEGTFALTGEVPLDTNLGGFSWKVASVPSPFAAGAMLRNFAERGLRAAVFQETTDNRVLYVLLLGQFASVADAEASSGDLPTTGVGRDVEIVPIFELALLSAEDLDRLRPD